MQIDPVPTAPVETEPRGFVSGPDQREQLLAVLADAGVALGNYDHRVIDWLTASPGYEWSTVATIASWIQRARPTTPPATENVWGSARPWLTADAVVIRGGCVLLIQRADEPYKGSWALPGGYVDDGETSRAAAARELEEETGIVAMPEELVQVGAYDAPDRDPRERVVTVAYLLEVASGVTAVAGDDAAAVGWWPLDGLPPLAFDHADIIRAATRDGLPPLAFDHADIIRAATRADGGITRF